MPVEGTPGREHHRFWFYWHKWHYPEEGTLVVPEATGPLSAMRSLGAAITRNEPALRFVCFRCQHRRRLIKRIIFVAFALIVGTVLLLQRLDLI